MISLKQAFYISDCISVLPSQASETHWKLKTCCSLNWNNQTLLQIMQCISSQTTDGICIFTFRKTHPILTEIKLPQSLRTNLAEHVIMKMAYTCKLVLSSFLFSKNIFLYSQAYCVSRSGKWWKCLYPLTVFFCTCRPAKTRLVFLCVCMFCHKQLSQDYKGLRISPSIANLLPTVTLRFFDMIFFKVCALSGTFQPPFHPHLHFFNLNVILECFVSNLSR